jgi:uncharacterized membrane protein YwaF
VDAFAAFSPLHFAALATIGVLTAAAIAIRRRRPPSPLPAGPLERTIGFAYLALWIGAFVWLRVGPLYDPTTTYPLWFFWSTHGMIVGVACYDIAARGYRPGWRDFGLASLAAAFYVMFVLPIDLVTGWNYGFVGPSRPDVPSIVDLLGPWPRRLVAIVAIAAGVMFALLVPWLLARRGATAGR